MVDGQVLADYGGTLRLASVVHALFDDAPQRTAAQCPLPSLRDIYMNVGLPIGDPSLECDLSHRPYYAGRISSTYISSNAALVARVSAHETSLDTSPPMTNSRRLIVEPSTNMCLSGLRRPTKPQLLFAAILCGCISICFWADAGACENPTEQLTNSESTDCVPISDVKKIEKLLEVARFHASEGRCTFPVASSAADAYRMVMELYPAHPEAVEGLRRLDDNPNCKYRGKVLHRSVVRGNEEVARLLRIAGIYAFAGRFNAPRGANALESYEAVLVVDPNNMIAQQAIEYLSELLEGVTGVRILHNDTDEVLSAVEDELRLTPDHEGLLQLKTEICRGTPTLSECRE